jgi:ABC-2 type transport system permease protein
VKAVERPHFLSHLLLLWGLRLRIAANRWGPSRRWLPAAAFVLSSAPAPVLGVSFFELMRLPAVADSELWPDFIVRLLSFVTTCMWVTWPVLSAGVDDHSELSRYAAFPISSFRLMVASTVASLFEPRALVFYGPLVGAALGYVATRPPAYPLLAVACFAVYVLFNAALSRVGLHLVLNVLRQRRSAELLGGGFALTLVGASFIPPVDTRWLFNLDKAGVAAVPDSLLTDATLALGRFPTGFFAHALTMAAAHRPLRALADLFWLAALLGFSLWVAWRLLRRFHEHSGRTGGFSGTTRLANPFARTKTLFGTLAAREAVDLWHNPRARLLAAVPFVLGILLKLLSGRDLFVFFLGATADAWLLSGLTMYGAIVLGSTFSQNAFAYDGHGFSAFLSAPVELGLVLKAKNLVHAVSAALLAVAVGAFYVLYIHRAEPLDVLCAVFSVATLIAVVLTAGNFLSVYFPVKFHANLKRRDKLPFVASMLGVAAAGLGTAPLAWALRARGAAGPSFVTLGAVVAACAVSWLAYWRTLPLAVALLTRRRELVLKAVTRE